MDSERAIERLGKFLAAFYDEAWQEGFEEGKNEALVDIDMIRDEGFADGYNAGHNNFIAEIVNTLDFRGQEAMVEHIERAIGLSPAQRAESAVKGSK